jgi:hypothetical protein
MHQCGWQLPATQHLPECIPATATDCNRLSCYNVPRRATAQQVHHQSLTLRLHKLPSATQCRLCQHPVSHSIGVPAHVRSSRSKSYIHLIAQIVRIPMFHQPHSGCHGGMHQCGWQLPCHATPTRVHTSHCHRLQPVVLLQHPATRCDSTASPPSISDPQVAQIAIGYTVQDVPTPSQP